MKKYKIRWINCPICGNEIKETDKKCRWCKSNLQEQEQTETETETKKRAENGK